MEKKEQKIIKTINKIFDRLEKRKPLYKTLKSKKVNNNETLYIDYYGEIIPLPEAVNRVFKINKKLKKINI
jgi:hypothetical protein